MPRLLVKSAGGALTQNAGPRELSEFYTQSGLDAYDQEPDVAGLQDFAKRRSVEGGSALINALAAGYAGERFAPVQSLYLKKASAAQEPLKVGTGYVTPEGEYVKDPSASRDRRAETFLRLGQQYASLADRQEGRDQNADLRRDLAAMSAGQQGGANDARTWRAEDNLRKDFDKATGDLQTELGATRKITEIIGATPPGGRPDAITQQSLVILLNKFLDPGSVVREGEFDRVIKAQGLEGRARNLVNNILKGEPLNDVAIQQINGLAQLYQQAAETKLRSTAMQYSELARQRGLDPAAVIINPSYRGGSADPNDPLGLRAR
jgi:hypothetical protein